MSTQEDILTPRAQRKRNGQSVQDNTKPVSQADMTYVSDTGDPNDAVRQSVYDNTQQRIEAMKGAQGNAQGIDVQGKGLAPTYGQQQVPQATPLPTAAPNPSQAQVTPQQLATSPNGVLNTPKATPIPVQGKVTEQKKPLTYDDVLALMGKQHEDEQTRIKKEKRRNLFATIGNGLSALSNLYYTTKGAPSAFTPELSTRMRARYDELEKQRTANDKAYLNAHLAMLEKQRNDERIRQRNEITNNYYKTKSELEREKQRQEAALKKQQQEFAQELAKRKQDEVERNNEEKNRIARERATTYKNSVNKRTSNQNGGKSGSKYYAYDNEGNIHYYPNKSMWEQAVNRFAKEADIPATEQSTSTHVSDDGFGMSKTSTTTTTKKRTAAEKGADLESKAKGKKGNGSSNGKSSQNGKVKVNW